MSLIPNAYCCYKDFIIALASSVGSKMIPYAMLRPGRGFQPGRAALYYAQRVVTEPRLRQGISRSIASALRLRHGTGSTLPLVSGCGNAADTLHQQGIVMLDNLVTDATVTAIVDYFLPKDVVGTDGHLAPVDELPRDTAMASYPLRTILESPEVLNLINAPSVLQIAADYLRCKPTLSSLGVRWSFPGATPAGATQRFHRDPDDWRFLKLFVYLTDVEVGSGPHVYVAQSHRTAGQTRSSYYARSDLEAQYGSGNVRTVTGRRGTSFMADTYGIHAGMVPEHAPRLILQAQYSLLPVFALKYEPIALRNRTPVDRYVNRLLFTS
jgi:hypothetical protein